MSLHNAPRWSSEFLLRSLDTNRTPVAKRKAGLGIRIERIRGRICVVRTIAAQALPITSYQLSRFSR